MTKKPENPPAFPCNADAYACGSVAIGMTLRDYFAAAALTGFIASDICMGELDAASKGLNMTGAEEAEVQTKVISSRCYLIADAMLAAREAV